MGGCASSAPQGGSDFHSDYLLSKKLGEGSFAQVFLCKERGTSGNNNLAVKVLDVDGNATARKDARKEARLWQRIADGPNVVQLLSFSEDRKFCYLVMEKCHCTVLQAFLEHDDSGEEELAHCFQGMLEALQFIHSRGVVHRDVKPDNFLIQGNTGFSKDLVVKLCDFGLAAALPPKKSAGKGFSLVKSAGLTNVCGTAPYMAPEMLTPEKGGYGTAVDIWAMGVAGYLMLFGEFPYRPARAGSKEMMDAIKANIPPTYKAKDGFPQPSKEACGFVRELLARAHQYRPDAEEAKRHIFINRGKKPQVVAEPDDCPTIPGYIRSEHRKQSFAETIKVAREVANKMDHYKMQGGDVVRFPSPDAKANFEKALMEMQREHGASMRQKGRTMSDPSQKLAMKLAMSIGDADLPPLELAKSDPQALRGKTRLSTHSGSFCTFSDKEKAEWDDGRSTTASFSFNTQGPISVNTEAMSFITDAEAPFDHYPSFGEEFGAPDAWKCVSEKHPRSDSRQSLHL
eukprot:gnl/MRDRNA2_/MRDRNA2_61640_c0_seq1.p1 gnl/MRDRNA2_/MRDRNA2_61640_c0~~gnl/MRDRNA2_/MRDRNA2_61640_c0_seq1.p1  ORF type:complete len:514 (-),score=120.92 gnl/MRDRNA2_/MRDRNA2_61640_c0_seq1:241-1782(-)